MPNALKITKDAKYMECQGMKTRYLVFRNATRSIGISSKKYIKSDAVEAFEKAEFASDAIIGFMEDKYKITSKLEGGIF